MLGVLVCAAAARAARSAARALGVLHRQHQGPLAIGDAMAQLHKGAKSSVELDRVLPAAVGVRRENWNWDGKTYRVFSR